MSSYKVEKSVPIPPRGRPRKYPLPDMEIGESFSVAEDDENRIRTAIQYYKRERGLRFRTKKYKERGRTRIRIWRVE